PCESRTSLGNREEGHPVRGGLFCMRKSRHNLFPRCLSSRRWMCLPCDVRLKSQSTNEEDLARPFSAGQARFFLIRPTPTISSTTHPSKTRPSYRNDCIQLTLHLGSASTDPCESHNQWKLHSIFFTALT
ncbi:hypothetical protein JOD03_002069, partial [Chryseomicrobium aureum]|nr:hypothetical protein [Chryseomicrobium aureum]